jgi:predicted phosphate transport protein (TIGR00153 family)
MGIKDFLFRQQRQVTRLYMSYMETWRSCAETFVKAMELYLEQGLCDEFDYLCQQTHKLESQADDIRRDIEFQLYAKAMLPESRGDIFGVLEAIDRVINKAESVLFQIQLEKISIPGEMKDHVTRITTITDECLQLVYDAASRWFDKNADMIGLAELIDEKESRCDHAGREAMRAIFSSDMEWHLRFQLKNLVSELGNISDRSEEVSDRLVITSIKRRV